MQITDILNQTGGLQSIARELGISESEAGVRGVGARAGDSRRASKTRVQSQAGRGPKGVRAPLLRPSFRRAAGP